MNFFIEFSWKAFSESHDGKTCIDHKVNYPAVGVGLVENFGTESVYKYRNVDVGLDGILGAFKKPSGSDIIRPRIDLKREDGPELRIHGISLIRGNESTLQIPPRCSFEELGNYIKITIPRIKL